MLLERLSSARGVSGDEGKIRDIIREELDGSNCELRTDKIGNIIAYKKGRNGGPKIGIIAPMDEIGLMVTKITKDGLLKFTRVGNFDYRLLVSKVVTIGDSGLKGVIGAKPIHLQQKNEREKSLSTDKLYIDIGVNSEEEAKKHVSIGDYVSIDSKYKELLGENIKGKALDSRVSCKILLDLLKGESEHSIYGIFSTMKKVGIHGAGPAFYELDADYAIVVDGIDSELTGGAVLSIKEMKTVFDREISDSIINRLEKEDIRYQLSGYEHDNSDAINSQITADGFKMIKIGFPCAYKNTSTNIVNQKDIGETEKLLELVIKEIGGF